MLVAGTTVIYKVVGKQVVHCERCGGDRPFKRRSGRSWVRVLGVPVYPLAVTGEHLRCTICRTCYRVELLRVPTAGQMQAALLDGTKAAVLAMLRAGDPASRVARKRAVEVVSAAGAQDYSEDGLTADLAGPARVPGAGDGSGPPRAVLARGDTVLPRGMPPDPDGPEPPAGAWPGLRQAIENLAVQLEPHAREWFLSKVVRVGLAGGSLSGLERDVAGAVARYLGMSQSRADDVILLAEKAAQAG